MFMIDRQGLFNYAQGILLSRDEDSMEITPEAKCIEAERRLNNSETIGLTINDELVSVMRINGESYFIETAIEDIDEKELKKLILSK